MTRTTTSKSAEKLQKLLDLLDGKKNLLIFLQDHPDPDAVGSGAALRRIANSKDVACSLVHSGMVGRAENRALVDYLGLNLRKIATINLTSFDIVAMVDTQPGTGNNPLPEGTLPDIVIDHHPIHKQTRAVRFTDVRKGYGATSTILTEYLREARLKPETPLATALMYGIRSDTLDLGRQAKKPDFDAHYYLYSRANLRMLAQIQHGALPPRYYQLLYTALDNAQTFGNCIYTRLGKVQDPDMIGEVADLLVRRESIEWCLCVGVVKKTLLLSLRSRDGGRDAGKIIQSIVGKQGTAGGHNTLAGGQVPLQDGTLKELTNIEEWLVPRFRHVLHQEEGNARSLVRKPRQ